MKKIGTLKPLNAKKIRGSKIGVGFECVERKMWDDTPELYRSAGESGVKHARVLTGWFRTEREKGVYDFSWLDKIVDQLLEQGIHPWFCLSYGNKLYSDSPGDDAAGYPPLFSEEARNAWKNYVHAVVRHFHGKVTHYEIWNEPNCSGFWIHGPNAEEYIDLVKLTSPVIRDADPDATIIGGASGYSIGGWNGFQIVYAYLRLGICNWIDAFTYHRYHIMPELNTPEDFRMLRKAFESYGGSHIQLWQGESGCPSKQSNTEALLDTPVNETVQAKVLLRSILTDLMNGLDYTCYFTMSDFKYYYRNGLNPNPNYFGLVTFDDPPRRKPAYFAFQSLCNLFDDQTVFCDTIKLDFKLAPFPDKERFVFQEMRIRLKTARFERKGFPLIAIWLPVDLLPEVSGNAPFKEKEILMQIWTPGKNIETPVLIDPLTQEVFEPELYDDPFFHQHPMNDRPLDLNHIPVRDYPMIVTDRKAIEDIL